MEQVLQGPDYEVSYADNINVGTAKVILKGKGNYTDTVEKTFTIGHTGIEVYKDKASLSGTSYEYDGTEKRPEVRIEGLTEGQDYEVSYEANINAGKAKVIISGRGNYGGSFVRTYSITPKSITKLEEKIVLSESSYIYDGKAKQPTVYIGGLKADADYTVDYQNNTNIGMATVVIQGKNNYKGAILKRYSITAALNKTYNISGELYRVVNNASNGSGRVTFKGITAKKTDKKIKTVTVRNTVKIGGCNFKVVAVEQKAFKNFSNITKVTIGNNVETIGKQSFSGCKKLKTLTVGSKVKTIGKQTFSGCKNLKTIIINTPYLTKKSVGAKAFKGIHAKATIKVPKKQKKAYQKFLKSKGIGKKVKIK